MSTIAGLIRFTDQPVDQSDLKGAAKYMADPGVGAAVFWCEGSAGLVVRQRFSTPEDRFERQPWIGGGGRLVLVFDGRLDNRQEISDALGLSVDPTEVIPDGALLLRAFERWGENALARLLGDFALAVWDGAERRLLLARDPCNQRTLYIHHGEGFVAFASTLRALLAMPKVPWKLSEEGLCNFLTISFQFAEETLYDGLFRIPPATAVIIDRYGVRRTPYWTFDPDQRTGVRSDSDYVEAARMHLDQAVARRLRSDGPISATMSGGLDSSSVAATAARLMSPNRLLTLTAVPPPGLTLPPVPARWYADETPYVRSIARMHPNMDHRLIWSGGPQGAECNPTALFDAGAAPIISISNFGWYTPLLEASLQAGARVILGGQVGNNGWSWGGLSRLRLLFQAGRWVQLARELDAVGKTRGERGGLFRSHVLRPLCPAWLAWVRRRGRDVHPRNLCSGINPEFAAEIGLSQRDLRAVGGPLQRRNQPEWSLRMDGLTQYSRSDGRAVVRALLGIDDRDPLADRNLVEFCLAVPSDQFLRDGVTRRLPRHAMADRLPREVLNNNRLGQQNPEWFARLSVNRSRMMDVLSALQRSPIAGKYLDLPRLSNLLHNWPESPVLDAKSYHYVLPRALHIGQFLLWFEKNRT